MIMISEGSSKRVARAPEVLLDGESISLPPERRTLAAIRSYLDLLALQNHRILYDLHIDGERAELTGAMHSRESFGRVEAETIDLQQVPLQLIRLSLEQAEQAREKVHAAVVLVLINEGCVARSHWWELAARLKEPLLTLSLLPESACGPANGPASMAQLRRWQLEQLGRVLQDVDGACWTEDSAVLSNALENRVLPWLNNLHAMLTLWHDTLIAGARRAHDPRA